MLLMMMMVVMMMMMRRRRRMRMRMRVMMRARMICGQHLNIWNRTEGIHSSRGWMIGQPPNIPTK